MFGNDWTTNLIILCHFKNSTLIKQNIFIYFWKIKELMYYINLSKFQNNFFTGCLENISQVKTFLNSLWIRWSMSSLEFGSQATWTLWLRWRKFVIRSGSWPNLLSILSHIPMSERSGNPAVPDSNCT